MKLAFVALTGALFYSAVLPGQDDELQKSIARGKEVYTNNCVACHQATGEGVEGVFPPLAKSDYLIKTPEKAIHAIKFGLQGAIEVNGVEYDNMMPEPGLSQAEVADVMNYIMNSWGNSSNKKMITVKMVESVKQEEEK
ncbi:c-type cytochrome [Telluribacter humicola]|uniref:c-type cytochrome n=1 Tax=Telluribacter humicola TaxID=1720261 RepID=UPI001A9648EA|nr:cytochrome c [Telluribacter humicola]